MPASSHGPREISGAVVLTKGTALLGINQYLDRGVDWLVLRRRDGRWRPTALSARSHRWDEQGLLYRFGPLVYAMRFDQRRVHHDGHAGLAARYQVRTFDPVTGRAVDVGGPLMHGKVIYGPITYGMAAGDHTLYALYGRPDKAHRTNDEVVAIAHIATVGGA